ncbi:CHAT domain-containing protein [Aspergillus karnatakaensis]|uniref:CHAT domain-containing protein n=1 Tax=Aspergillus karnatakaensis TaxID=1810916 RepID=UPI003CCCEB12
MQAITRLELPDLSARQVKTYRRASGLDLTTRGAGSGTGSGMRGAPPDTARQQDKRDRRFLAHLWTNCVRLVLDKLGVLVNQPTPSSAAVTADLLPRVWWIGTGLASALPFHAAGIHSNEAAHVGENAFAYVISSYTPSIKALGFARERAVATIPKPIEQRGLSPAAGDVLVSEQENKLMGLQTEHDKHQSLLLVTMPETPGMWNLSGVDQEQTKITDALRLAASKAVGTEATASSTTILKSQPQVMRQPSAKAVLHALRSHSIVHFACHGASDLLDPSKSFLALQPHPFSGSTKSSTSTQSSPNRPRQPDKLTVHEIAESRLRRSWLAYLSACSTAENQVAELADEALHLASGFQVAGYAHTIAAMWPSNDAICAEVAGAFYAELLANWDPDRSSRLNSPARALQAAVGGIRARNIDRPSLWAQYIHMGA